MELFKDRLKEAMNDKGYRQIDVVEKYAEFCKRKGITDLKLPRSQLSMHLSGKFEPSSQRIAILAKVLDVSEAWLIGYDVPKGAPSLDLQPDIVVEQYDRLTDTNKARLLAYLEALIDSQGGE